MTQRIGIIGLGEMGGTIAKRLHARGADILVYDSDTAKKSQWPQHFWAGSVPELAGRSDIILLIVATTGQLHEVIDSMTSHLAEGTIVVVHATVHPATVQTAADTIHSMGGHLIDAGMSRGSGRMIEGSLTLFIGGDEVVIDRARDVFDLYSDTIVHAGPLGTGMVLKLCNNLALHGNRMILLEAARIAAANGVDPDIMVSGLGTSTGSSWVARHWGTADRLALRGGAGQTPMVERTRRELDTVLALANTVQVEVPTAALVTKRLPSVLRSGLATTDRLHLLEHKQSRVTEWRSARDRTGSAFWSPLLVLTTTGAKTGRPRECVLEFMTDSEAVMVFGSNGGQLHDPQWITNLRAHSRVTVEIGPHSVGATATVVDPVLASQVYARRAATNPVFIRYEAEAGDRPIPVVRIEFDSPLQIPTADPR